MSDSTGRPRGQRVSIYLPTELHEAIRQELPGLNVSQVVQEALRDRLECRHGQLACARCAAPISRQGIADVATGALYSDVMWELQTLVRRGGTAEGAARVLKDVALRHGVPGANELPLPRPSDAERKSAKVKDFGLPRPPHVAAVEPLRDERAADSAAGA